MRSHPGPHHDRPARPLTARELTALDDLEIRLAVTRSGLRSETSWSRAAATTATALLVVLVLVAVGALTGPAGVVLVGAVLVIAVCGSAVYDLLRWPGP
ncbi:hypothetical protein WCD74_27165 [Actinomycetospora sp. OC33-EN08]|uniref:DUF3040 domain-containing protein n=1 Tax=Actinomycetospora aurantiaca TaxID=3129233 RepID=A0ABU8MWZ8_9PSEU